MRLTWTCPHAYDRNAVHTRASSKWEQVTRHHCLCYSFFFHCLARLLISDHLSAASLAIHSSSNAMATGTQQGHPAHLQLQARPICSPFAREKWGIPPPARPVCYVQSVMGKWVAAGGGSLPFTSTSGRVNWKEPPLPVEHHRPGLMRRVLLRHLYTPWVPLTAWNRYSWSSGACPIMSSCHGAQQAPPLPTAAAVLEHSSGEGCLIPGGMGGCGWPPPAPQVHCALPHHSTLITFSVWSLQ